MPRSSGIIVAVDSSAPEHGSESDPARAHEWEVKGSLELLDIRATNETHRKIQYTVDKATKRWYIDLEDLAYREATSFKSHY